MRKGLLWALVLLVFVFPFGAAGAEEMPAYAGHAVTDVNGGVPEFTEDELVTREFTEYAPQDELGRTVRVTSCVGPVSMLRTVRDQMTDIIPSGWQNTSYDFVNGGSLYQRCHILGNRFGGDECPENLFTGTKYLNLQGMTSVEDRIANYIVETGEHVMYRATPDFRGDNLLANGLRIEAQSVESDGFRLHVYLHNVQPGVAIDYSNGLSQLAESTAVVEADETANPGEITRGNLPGEEQSESRFYILNTNSRRFHYPECKSVSTMKEKNKDEFVGTREQLMEMGYKPCGSCKP